MSGAAEAVVGTPVAPDDGLWRAVEHFYRREAVLLQDRRYRDWLALMDEGIKYRLPVTADGVEGLVVPDRAIGYYDEDLELLTARVAKLESKQSWVENPPSRLRYFVQLLALERLGNGEIAARCNILLLQSRWNLDQQFSGDRRDVLVERGHDFALRSRLVVMDRKAFTHQGLSVFF